MVPHTLALQGRDINITYRFTPYCALSELIFYISCTQGVALGWYILPLQGAVDGLHSCLSPTTVKIFERFQDIANNEIIEDDQVIRVYRDELSELQKEILSLLGM